jgi:hypothetical protein
MVLPRSLPAPRTPDPMDAPPLRWGARREPTVVCGVVTSHNVPPRLLPE